MGLACLQTLLEEGQDDDWFSSHFIMAMAAGSAIGAGAVHLARAFHRQPGRGDLRVLRHRSRTPPRAAYIRSCSAWGFTG